MNRVGEHPVSRGPLAPRWLAWALDPQRAGAATIARLTVENAGTATWHSRGADGVQASYHWLDVLGNPIVWDGPRTPLPHPVAPGEKVALDLLVTAPRPPGAYRLAFDLVEEHCFWFSEVGGAPLDVEVEVAPRIAERRLAVRVHGEQEAAATAAALTAQEEPVVESEAVAVAHLVAGAVPPPDWSRRVLDAHAEGWAAVGTAVVPDGRSREFEPWRGGSGRNPRLGVPLLLPSLLDGLEPTEHLGLPAYDGPDALFDGSLEIRLPRRSGRQPR